MSCVRWKRYFTPTAGQLFKMEADHALQTVTRSYDRDFDKWEGDCR